jgi:hypothetical protein
MGRWSIRSIFVAAAILIAVAVVALRIGEPGRSFASIHSYDLLADGRTIVLALGVGRLDSIGSIGADEDASSVRVRVLLLHHSGTAPGDIQRVDVYAVLKDPLGSRTVLDQDGRAVPRRAR